MVKGQFVSIDEGNRTERVLLGLGAGRTGVQASVQVYEITPEGMRNVESLQADAKSSYKPGMALMMGAGGFCDTVNSDGSRLAKNVAKHLGQFFVIQRRITPE